MNAFLVSPMEVMISLSSFSSTEPQSWAELLIFLCDPAEWPQEAARSQNGIPLTPP